MLPLVNLSCMMTVMVFITWHG